MAETIEDNPPEIIKENRGRIQEIVGTTWLSRREAQIHVIREQEPEMNYDEIADLLGLERETVYQYRRNAKDKIRKSKETVELDIST